MIDNFECYYFNKEQEYDFLISLSEFFTIANNENIDEKQSETLINSNVDAILMPYLRSEVSLLTAQSDIVTAEMHRNGKLDLKILLMTIV